MAPHSSTLAWKIPWMEEPGGLPSMGLQSQTQLKRLSSSSSSLVFYSVHLNLKVLPIFNEQREICSLKKKKVFLFEGNENVQNVKLLVYFLLGFLVFFF